MVKLEDDIEKRVIQEWYCLFYSSLFYSKDLLLV